MARQRSAQPRYRRRVVLEITPDESTLLDALADRQGTIRGAVMAGLRALQADDGADHEAQVRDLHAQLDAARADRDRVTAEAASLTEQLAEREQALQATRTAEKELRSRLRDTRARLGREQTARKAAGEATRASEALRVHHVYCAACDKLVPEAEWAEQAANGGAYLYHRPHGFRAKDGGLFGEKASLLAWRSQPLSGGRS